MKVGDTIYCARADFYGVVKKFTTYLHFDAVMIVRSDNKKTVRCLKKNLKVVRKPKVLVNQ